MKHGKRTKLTSEDINNSLRLRNLETLYGYSSKEPLHFQKASKDLYYIDDKEIDFQDILSKPLPKIPRDSSLGTHWLSIEGTQPPIPQNPQPGILAI